MKKAVAYLRVSTDAERQAHGLEVQRRSIDAWADLHGVQVIGWHQDEASGTREHERRPGLVAALAQIGRKEADTLIVYRLDRLARDAAEGAILERKIQRAGAVLAVVEGGGTGEDAGSQLVRRVMLAAAEFEGRLIRDRIRATKASLRARGLFEGGAPPYGWRVENGRLVEAPEEVAQLRELAALRARGLSWRALVRVANERGMRARAGAWTHQGLARVIPRWIAGAPEGQGQGKVDQRDSQE